MLVNCIMQEDKNPTISSSNSSGIVFDERIGREALIDPALEHNGIIHNKAVDSSSEKPLPDYNFYVGFAENDVENPKNFSKAVKWSITTFTGVLCFAVAFGSSMPTGDLEGAAEELGVGSVAINLSITLFVVGFGFGPMFFAALSEVIGRQPVYCITMFLYFSM